MSDARADVMQRIRTALGSTPAERAVPRDYHQAGADRGFDVVERFCERVADYDATVHRLGEGELNDVLAQVCRARGVSRLAVSDVPWAPDGVELVRDDPPLGARDLDAVDGVLSGCALAIAETGTIVLDGAGASGRRALSLVPDLHLCVVRADQVVPAVPDAIAALEPAARDGRPITFVSGPSATADIELIRVQGVHGPRTLDVFVLGE
ncbi:MAG: L-lactate dehydrogenase complex protein LldG [Solirubrobacteraceae bacterium]|nr:L-lactate dehydrogenase complex protein LldG [Solirubrobacteraceae bacterium]